MNTLILDFANWDLDDAVRFMRSVASVNLEGALQVAQPIIIEWSLDYPLYTTLDTPEGEPTRRTPNEDVMGDLSFEEAGTVLRAIAEQMQKLMGEANDLIQVDMKKWKMRDHQTYLKLITSGDMSGASEYMEKVITKHPFPNSVIDFNFEQYAQCNAVIMKSIQKAIADGK